MSLTETLAGIAVLAVFLASLGSTVPPLARSLERSRLELERAKSIEFLDRTFRDACAAGESEVETWKREVAPSVAESCDVLPCRSGGVVRAMRAACVSGGVRLELLAEIGNE